MTRATGARRWWSLSGALALATLLSGSYCDSRGYYTPGGGGGAAAQTSVGPISRFGSVFVDGPEFTDGSATITVDGTAAAESQLLSGQIATAVGNLNSAGTSGTATSIAVTTKVRGPVAAIDLPGRTVTVLGQVVRLVGDTSAGSNVAPADVGGLLLGDLVAVDGYRTSNGFIATRFDRANSAQSSLLAGAVSALSGATQSFSIGAATVDYSALSSGLPGGVTNGSYVVVAGAAVGTSALLRASSITAVTETPTASTGRGGTVHGAITRYVTSTDFDVAGLAVTTSSATTYTNGSAADLAADAELIVSGTYASTGALAATTVEFPASADGRVVGSVYSLNSSAATLQVAGITISTVARTRWDDRATALRIFHFTDLRSGDWVEIRGVSGSGASMTARVIERRTALTGALTELQDLAAGVADPNFTLMGIPVDSRSAVFTDAKGVVLTRASFFSQAAGALVRAKGTLSVAGTLVAQTVALRQ